MFRYPIFYVKLFNVSYIKYKFLLKLLKILLLSAEKYRFPLLCIQFFTKLCW